MELTLPSKMFIILNSTLLLLLFWKATRAYQQITLAKKSSFVLL